MVQVNFVVDCSGSMGAAAFNPLRDIGFGYTALRDRLDFKMARWELVSALIETTIYFFNKHSTFQIVEFESSPRILVPTTTKDSALRTLEKQRSPQRDNYQPFYPRGGTNIPEGLRATLNGADKNVKNITILITDMWDQDGSYISNALNADCGNGDSCFKALADLGPVYVIVIGDHNSKIQMEKGCKGLNKLVSQDYGINWDGCFSVPLGDLGSLGYFNKLIYEFTDHYGTLSLGPERQHTRQPY